MHAHMKLLKVYLLTRSVKCIWRRGSSFLQAIGALQTQDVVKVLHIPYSTSAMQLVFFSLPLNRFTLTCNPRTSESYTTHDQRKNFKEKEKILHASERMKGNKILQFNCDIFF